MNIYKLKYNDKETAIADFIAKGIYVEVDSELVYAEGIQAIVEIGLIEEVEGYHYDIMSIQDIDFESNEIVVNNPKHNFAGYE
jgi:hypothetical protein